MTQKAIVLDYFLEKFLQTQKFLPLEMYIYIKLLIIVAYIKLHIFVHSPVEIVFAFVTITALKIYKREKGPTYI